MAFTPAVGSLRGRATIGLRPGRPGLLRTASIAGAISAVLCLTFSCRGDEAAAVSAEAALTPATISPLDMMRQPIGDRLPDTPLVDDKGREVRFFSDLVKNQAVVISFYYTNCRGTCPGTNLVLADVRDLLAKDFGKSVRIISISVEPEKDDVEAIAEYASQFRREATDPDTPDWVFVTGKPEDIRDLRYKLGYYEIDPVVDRDPTQHAATVIIGNQATGRWGMMPVGIGAEKLAGKVRYLAGWTNAQRFSAIYPSLGREGGRAAAAQPPVGTTEKTSGDSDKPRDSTP
ncbi:MAG: SCO family protein [Planctomycetia bacterium]|nr:SCO family protein [Planctomycetia bacterium]